MLLVGVHSGLTVHIIMQLIEQESIIVIAVASKLNVVSRSRMYTPFEALNPK